MKQLLTKLTLAAATILLLGSCAKINERIDDLEGRINGLKSEEIASISTQITSITSSIADLGTIRTNIQNLTATTAAQAQDIKDLNNEDTEIGKKISDLKKADESINKRIDDLQKYVNDTLKAYGTKEWVEATFSTLAQYEATCDTIAKIDARIGALDSRLSQSIEDCADSLKSWVNVQLDGYYSIAQMDAKVAQMNAQIDTLKSENEAKADSLKAEIAATKAELDTVKANIRTEYKSAIETAITELDGKLSAALEAEILKVNNSLSSLNGRVITLENSLDILAGRVEALEGMIQSVVIIPAYSDGSVEIQDGNLYIDCIINPGTAVGALDTADFNILLTSVLTKAVAIDTVPTDSIKVFSKDISKGIVSIKANIKDILVDLDSSIAVAVNVTKGKSDYTSEFVPGYIQTKTFKAVYNTNGEANTLTFYYDDVDHSGDHITVYQDGTTNFLFDGTKTNTAIWGYNNNRGNIKKVIINPSVAEYKGLTSTTFMFQGMTTATEISGAEYLDVSNVTDMSWMFNNFGNSQKNNINSVPDVREWNTANVTNMMAMFTNYGNYSSTLNTVPDVSKWNTAKVTNMSYMFQKYGYSSTSLNDVPDVSDWSTGEVTTMQYMFNEYGRASTSLNTVPDMSNWNTVKVTNMSNMFKAFGKDNTIDYSIDLSNWDLTGLESTNGSNFFQDFNPKTFKVRIPLKTGSKDNDGTHWYYGIGTNYIAPPTNEEFLNPDGTKFPEQSN